MFYNSIKMQLACLIILLFITLSYMGVRRVRSYSHFLFSTSLTLTILNALITMGTIYSLNHMDSLAPFQVIAPLYLFLGSLVLEGAVIMSYSVTMLLQDDEKAKRVNRWVYVPVVPAVLLMMYLPIDFVRTDFDNYADGPAVWVPSLVAAAYIVASFIMNILLHKRLTKRRVRIVCSAFVIMFVSYLVEVTSPTSFVSNFGLMIINLAFFMTVESPDAQMARELREEKDRADAANRAKSLFLSNMSHEIRTPINAVLGMDEMILRESNQDSVLEYARNIKSAGNALLCQVNDVLDFSKIEAGKMELIPANYSLSSLLNDIVVMVTDKAKNKGLALELDVENSLPEGLYGDEVRIRQIFVNILNNAVKYTEEGSVRLTLSHHRVDRDHVILNCHVRDTGIGIREEDLAQLFSAFERVDEKKNRTIEGTGLGLNITKQLLGMMGSTLEVESVYGVGSDFHFALEQKVVNWAPIGDFSSRQSQEVEDYAQDISSFFVAPRAHILIVDDTTMNLTVAKNLLKRTRINIDTATSGQESLRMMDETRYDIVFMDHRMPGMDGVETLHEIQKRKRQQGEYYPNAQTPIIVLTANAVSGMREQFLQDGFDDYISKPIDPVALEDMVRRYLRKELVETPTRADLEALKRPEPVRQQAPEASKITAFPAGMTTVNMEDHSKAESLLQEAEELAAVETGDSGNAEDHTTSGNSEDEEKAMILAALSGIPELDTQAGIGYCGDEDGYLEVTREYVNTGRERIAQLQQDYQEGDIRNYTIRVHAMKSASRVIGAGTLADEAAYLEACGDDHQMEEIQAKTPQLFEHFDALLAQLTEAFYPGGDHREQPAVEDGEAQDPNLPEIGMGELREAYDAILEVMSVCDYDSAESIMQSLSSYRVPESEVERCRELKQALRQMNADKIEELLR